MLPNRLVHPAAQVQQPIYPARVFAESDRRLDSLLKYRECLISAGERFQQAKRAQVLERFTEDFKASAPSDEQIHLLITIPGITLLTASAFLADVGDVHRFPSLRRMNAYLDLVLRCHDSGDKSRPGHITRESRKLSRTTLTQSIYQMIKGTQGWERAYEELKARRGSSSARIAMIRRLCGVMRRMLLQGEQFH